MQVSISQDSDDQLRSGRSLTLCDLELADFTLYPTFTSTHRKHFQEVIQEMPQIYCEARPTQFLYNVAVRSLPLFFFFFFFLVFIYF